MENNMITFRSFNATHGDLFKDFETPELEKEFNELSERFTFSNTQDSVFRLSEDGKSIQTLCYSDDTDRHPYLSINLDNGKVPTGTFELTDECWQVVEINVVDECEQTELQNYVNQRISEIRPSLQDGELGLIWECDEFHEGMFLWNSEMFSVSIYHVD